MRLGDFFETFLDGAFPGGPPQFPVENAEWVLANPDKAREARFQRWEARARRYAKMVPASVPPARATNPGSPPGPTSTKQPVKL